MRQDERRPPVSVEVGQDIVEFLNVDLAEIAEQIELYANGIEALTGVDLLAVELPLLGESLGGLLGGVPRPLSLDASGCSRSTPIDSTTGPPSTGPASSSKPLEARRTP